MSRILKHILVTIGLIILLYSVSFAAHATNNQVETIKENKTVLYISSYSYSLSTIVQQLDGIRASFQNQPIHIDVDFMYTKRANTPENYENFYQRIKYLLESGIQYDAVIVGDDNGLQFLMDNRENLFPNTPIFFEGINSIDRAIEASKQPMMTGVLEAKSFYETIEFAYMLNPTANRMVSIIDDSVSSQAEYKEVIRHEVDFKNLEFVSINMSEMTHEDFFTYIEEYCDTSDILFFLSAYRDINGHVLSLYEVHRLLDQALDTPIYEPIDTGIGQGIFGGKMLSHYDQGYAAGEMVVKYFSGTPIEEIEFVAESPNNYHVDFPQLKEFGYDINDLPEGTIIHNRTYTLWEEYGRIILATLVIFLLQSFIIFLLIINIVKRRKIERSLIESELEMKAMNEEMAISNDNLQRVNEELEDSICELNERDQKIKEMINVDKLTGLLSRFAIDEQIKWLLSKSDQSECIVLIDIDNFKNINDAFGHQYGDIVLKYIGERLVNAVGSEGEVGRFSGDEFVIVLKYKDEDSLIDIIESVQEEIRKVIIVEEDRLFLTVSMGIVNYPYNGVDGDELLRRADVALYESKSRGKDTYTIYNERMESNFHEKLIFQNYLRKGFEEEEFYLDYQPLVVTDTGQIGGYEALIRWKNPTLGQVSPYKLINEAEEMGLIIHIGEWIFKTSVAFAKRLKEVSYVDRYVSINVSAFQLGYKGFYSSIVSIIELLEVEPGQICIEITETALMENIDTAVEVLERLSDYGFKIAMDDFGTGYSSLNYLRTLPIDILKIDKSFIDNILTSTYDKRLVEAVIEIAMERNILVVAEGVEDKEQASLLKSMGCSYIQGYLFSKPMHDGEAIEVAREDYKY